MQPNGQTALASNHPAERVVIFGPFSLSLETGELRKGGVRIRLQNRPFQILKVLIDRPGHVVTRDELRAHLWPEDTFVDFENGLNTAANRLRLALCDSASTPRYIETLPRVGYRFIAPLRLPLAPTVVEESPEKPILAASVESPIRPIAAGFHQIRVLAAAVAFAVGVAAAFTWSRAGVHPAPVFHQLTFRRGTVDNARFTASGEVVYSAAWKDQPSRIFLMDTMSPESRDLDLGDAWLATVSRSSDLGFVRLVKSENGLHGELDVSALHGGIPRVVDSHIQGADWSPDGLAMCVVRKNSRGWTLEYPVGNVIYRSSGWFGRPRVSPKGDLIAVAEHPLAEDDGGSVLLLNRAGHVSRLSENWASLGGLAWNSSGAEVWFAAAKEGINRELFAVDLTRHIRRVASMPAVLDLFDISRSGRVLLGRSVSHLSMFVGSVKTLAVKDASWLDWSRAVALSSDGKAVLFDESGEGGGPFYTVYLYHRDQGTTERIGHGRAMDISSDGRWILTGSHVDSSQLNLISTVDSSQKTLRAPGLLYQSARFLSNSRNILVQANSGAKPIQTYLQNLETGTLSKIPNSEGAYHLVPSPDGKLLAGWISPTQTKIFDLSGRSAGVITSEEAALPVGWASNQDVVLAVTSGDGVRLQQVNISSHRQQTIKYVPGVVNKRSAEPFDIVLSADLKTFAYCRLETSTGLFAVDGWS
jgi:eukaryotic-like serine/threonine-protein kinase